MGVTEEAGKVAAGITTALQSQPLALALLVVNLLFVGFIGWLAHNLNVTHREERDARNQFIQRLVADCMPRRAP